MAQRAGLAVRSRGSLPAGTAGTKTRRVLLGVTGGIAAYKALELVRHFRKAGWDVQTVMTESARKFVGPESFRALTGHPVAIELFPRERATLHASRSTPGSRASRVRRPASGAWHSASSVEHVDLATSADLVVVAPATANIIGKLASGIADDLLSTLLLAVPSETVRNGRVLFAPAMNTNMWQNPAVTTNVRQLAAAGYRFISPGEGELACGTSGPGRMAEPPAIFEKCRAALADSPSPIGNAPLFAGTRVVVTAGRTEEPLDPVRVITNRSSGRMGIEIARAFVAAGAQVSLVAGELSVPLPSGVTVTQAPTTYKMLRAVLAALPRTDVLVMCAAVADYRPARAATTKHHDSTIALRLERTPDILKAVSRHRHHAVVVGFSLDDSAARARTKLDSKHLDLVVANPFVTAGSGTIKARLLPRAGKPRSLKPMSKPDFARVLVTEVARLLQGRTRK
ncbi:bifunctional phosphopantothenoylcysteine decarboxylase/phosphopantothenate--cysteine ligase CoaBC [candidate division WOR-3 bacterium]|uniref:Coenzyme A biosynthesis bifunctional protein CoaBC n=1 Tax=candidate division WOR-3 bacterium TaxID=2052148 RepID=A0A937XFU3_UNCW3|nr:bifunctional phosphopantothenoylcysteine decarboxylase/phosphopantothenate--cysteine ligase CoaBC [candidate division WOR-3 bacterium]